MMRIALVLAVVLAAAHAAADDWTVADTGFQLAASALIVADWGQTLSFTQTAHPGGELSPFLGEFPSRARVNTFHIAYIVGHATVAYMLPQPWRRKWQVIFIFLEGVTVTHNVVYGAGFQMPWG